MLPLLGAVSLAAASMVAAEPAPPGITAAPVLDERQASGSPGPLTESFFPYSAIPYQVNPYPVDRGPQSGYNQCNSTTEGADALCQTAVFNSIEDFCFWGAPGLYPNETIGDVEAAVVAYCSRSGHGARIFPEGTFKSIQYMKTPAYIQIVGFFNQNAVGLTSNDTGGELDPHGADLQGNPLGGLFYSTAFGAGGTEYVQTQEWNHFVGSGQFCLKLCDPTYNANGINYCQNIYDLIGCKYNMPADYAALESQELFVSCEGELQDVVGTYVENGATTTWRQPDPLTTAPPWEPRIPASSNCKTYKSTDLFPVASLGYQSTNTNPFHTSTSASASQATGSGASGASRTSHSGAVTGTPSGSSGSSNKSSPAIKTLPCVATVVLAVAAVFLA